MLKEFPLSEVYGLLEPGPVVMLATAENGRSNVMSMSWHMMVEFTPPLVACVVSGNDFSFRALRATGHCTIAIPTVEIADKVVAVGNCSGRNTDKFAAFGLTALPGTTGPSPLIAEAYANLECHVVDDSLGDTYNLFVLEVDKAWIDPDHTQPRTIHHHGYGRFVVDGETITLKSKMP